MPGIRPFSLIALVFVRDGIHTVADYNLTWMGVVVSVVVYLFHDGIT